MVAKTQEPRSIEYPGLLTSIRGRGGGFWERLVRWRLLLVLVVLGVLLALSALSALLFSHWSVGQIATLQGVLQLTGLALLAGALWLIWKDFIQPAKGLHDWTLKIRGGDLRARIPIPTGGEFSDLAHDLNSIGDMLQSLARDTEQQLSEFTEHTDQKTRSLSILYDVAASINISRDLDDLLTRFLHTLKEVVGARAAAVRLLTRDGQMRLVASVGLDDEMVEREQVLPAQSCLCGRAVIDKEVLYQSNMQACSKRVGREFFNGEQDQAMLVVPLQYRGRTLGIYNLYMENDSSEVREDLEELFTSIGRHLGMAIDKARVDEETNRLSIMEERTRLAHELHDSLAQTLASVRFQVRVLDEMLHQDDEAAIWQEMEKIESSIDEANTELRELIAHFRAPMDKRGLIPAIEQSIERFRQECGDCHVYLQKEWPRIPLPAEYEVHVLRIVQEALANIRKHAQAKNVRVMLRGDSSGSYRLLIEDDGIGMIQRKRSHAPGEHVGLSIMEDRARRIGGRLRLESEPGEGVRVLLTFRRQPEKDVVKNIYPLVQNHGTTRTRH